MSQNLDLIKSMVPGEVDLVEVVNSDNPAAMFGGAAARVAPDVEVVFAPPPGTGGPPLAFTGLEGLVEGWRDWLSPWHSYRIQPEEFVDAGDNVVLHAHVKARTERHGVDTSIGRARSGL